MLFGVLGPLEMRWAGSVVDLGDLKQRTLLAALLMEVNRPVPVGRLIDILWNDEPPRTARNLVAGYAHRLRELMKAVGESAQIVADRGGYRIAVDTRHVDHLRFAELVDQARAVQRTGDDQMAASLLREAIGLWRGDVLADLDNPRLCAGYRSDLRGRWLDALGEVAAIDLADGQYGWVLDHLRGPAETAPGRERLAGLLMRALLATDNRVEALQVYHRTRRALDEQGIQPGPDLQELFDRALHGRPATTPAQLPADLRTFTGRDCELAALFDHAARAAAQSAVAVCAIDGMPGVGKTALAIHTAHRVAKDYPDGQLFVDLHGYTADIPPVEPTEALARLLRTLGVAGPAIPRDLDDRAVLYRSRLVGRRMVILLDDAATESQIRPLLPGAPGCLVLVTSRRRLTGLDDAEPVTLGMLPMPDAVALFARTVGSDRTTATEPAVICQIVELCGRLPLAIRIAAGRLRHRPGWTADRLADLLRDERGRLAELEAGQRSVTAALNLSYQHLTVDQRRLYRRLGLHPGRDVEPYAAAALLGAGVDLAGRLLDDLHDAHLLTEPTAGRYQFHDLVRAHAATTVVGDAEGDRRAALGRLFDHYAHTTTVAMDLVYPFEADRRPRVPPSDPPTVGLDSATSAEGWIDAELDNLLVTATFAADHARPDHTLHQSATLHRHLRTHARYTDMATLHTHALTTGRTTGDRAAELGALTRLGDVQYLRGRPEQAADFCGQALDIARASGDRTGEMDALDGLGRIHLAQGRYERASDCLGQVLDIARDTGNRMGLLNVLIGLGFVHRLQGRYGQASDCFGQALDIARDIGNRTGELNALDGLGNIYWSEGRYEQATDHYGQVLGIARDTGNRIGELHALTGLGSIYKLQDSYEQAGDYYQQALRIARDVGYRTGELYALTGLGHVDQSQGRYEQAGDYYQQALRIARDVGNRNWQFEVHQGLGRAHHATGQHDDARTCHSIALDLATDLDQPVDQARAHDGLAHAHLALDDPDAARRHWQAALDSLTTIHADLTEEPGVTTDAIRAHLAELDGLEGRTA